jgi:hypothetical protein
MTGSLGTVGSTCSSSGSEICDLCGGAILSLPPPSNEKQVPMAAAA